MVHWYVVFYAHANTHTHTLHWVFVSSGSGVATLSDYRDRPQGSSGAKDDDEAQQFYAGGSEHSGQMIEGPPRKKANPQEIAKDVFEAAKK